MDSRAATIFHHRGGTAIPVTPVTPERLSSEWRDGLDARHQASVDANGFRAKPRSAFSSHVISRHMWGSISGETMAGASLVGTTMRVERPVSSPR